MQSSEVDSPSVQTSRTGAALRNISNPERYRGRSPRPKPGFLIPSPSPAFVPNPGYGPEAGNLGPSPPGPARLTRPRLLNRRRQLRMSVPA